MYLIADIETSGKSPNKHSIIQLACLIVNGKFQVEKEFNEFCRPHTFSNWDEESEQIHGITREKCETFQTGMALTNKFLETVRQRPLIFVCHASYRKNMNKYFDYEFLRNHCLLYNKFHEIIYGSLNKCVSTQLKKSDFEMLPDTPKEQNLKAWANYLNHSFNHHDALEDCYATLKVMKHLNKIGVSFE